MRKIKTILGIVFSLAIVTTMNTTVFAANDSGIPERRGVYIRECVGYEPNYTNIDYTHREEITLHKAAKAAFDETGLKKLPKVKALNAEYSDLLAQKKAAYPDYRKAREEMQELVKAQKNIELFFAEEKDAQEKQQTR